MTTAFIYRSLKFDYRVLELTELVQKQSVDVHAIQVHRTNNALATNFNISEGYRLGMNDIHSLGVVGIGFMNSLRC